MKKTARQKKRMAARSLSDIANEGVAKDMNARQAISAIATVVAEILSSAATATVVVKVAQDGLNTSIKTRVNANGSRSALAMYVPTK